MYNKGWNLKNCSISHETCSQLATGAAELFKCAKEVLFTPPYDRRGCGGTLGNGLKKLRAREVLIGCSAIRTTRKFTAKKNEMGMSDLRIYRRGEVVI